MGRARRALVDTFATHESLSVQHTPYAMGEATLTEVPEMSQTRLSMPNRHCLSVDPAPFGMENRNEVFVVTDEPHGLNEATMKRAD